MVATVVHYEHNWINAGVAERQGSGLQNRPRRFDSCHPLPLRTSDSCRNPHLGMTFGARSLHRSAPSPRTWLRTVTLDRCTLSTRQASCLPDRWPYRWNTSAWRSARKVAVNDLSLAVPSGSLFGLVGPNGAGKTTTLSMAVGLLRPHYGRSLVYGYDVWNDPVAAKSLLGVLPDGLALPAQFTGHELLTYFGRLRGMSEDVIASRRDELLAALDLADAGGTVIADYSAGMTKKIGLASALLHGPRLLVLDEPFEAVDPISSAGIRSILLSFVHSGGSVILSSHVMALVEQLCTHIGVIADGRVVASGTVDEVRAGNTLDEAFVRLVGSRSPNPDGLSWMRA